MKLHGYDPTQWELISSKSSLWSHGGDKGDCYSSKISVKPLSDGIDLDDIVEYFNTNLLERPQEKYTPKQFEAGAYCLVPCLFDVHFSKLISVDETGNYSDSSIAEEKFLAAIDSFIYQVRDMKFEKVIFPIGNDFFNSEASGDTFYHTRQDNDLRYGDMFKRGVNILISAIDRLKNVAPTKVVLVQGNHDFTTAFYASCVLNAYYRNDDYVSVDNSPQTRKYEKFGSTLLGFTHGNEEKDRIFSLMQNEVPNLWGETKFREWLIGHVHHESVREKSGVTVRTLPSITGHDAWHYKKGYTTSAQRSMAFVYDKVQGLKHALYE